MKIVVGQDDLVARWAGQQMKETFHAPFIAWGFTKDGVTLQGAAIFNDWNGSNIEITLYAPGCFTRSTVAAVYDYAFRQLKATRLSARTARSNKRMQRLLPRLGFTWEGVAKRYYGPDKRQDAILYALFPENAQKWMRDEKP